MVKYVNYLIAAIAAFLGIAYFQKRQKDKEEAEASFRATGEKIEKFKREIEELRRLENEEAVRREEIRLKIRTEQNREVTDEELAQYLSNYRNNN